MAPQPSDLAVWLISSPLACRPSYRFDSGIHSGQPRHDERDIVIEDRAPAPLSKLAQHGIGKPGGIGAACCAEPCLYAFRLQEFLVRVARFRDAVRVQQDAIA